VRLWWRKAVRDIGRRRGQFIAVIVTSFLGVALFGASFDAYRNLVTSYDALFARTHFADLTVAGGDVQGFASEARNTAGVTAVSTRTVTESYARVGNHRFIVRLVGLPAERQPALDQVIVLRGRYLDPARLTGILLEQHLADYYHLGPGDKLEVRTPLGWASLPILGVAASPEYLWPARSRQDVLTLPQDFGVAFAPLGPLQLMSGGSGRQALLTVAPGPDHAARLTRLEQVARDHGATSITTRADQPSNAALHEDIAGFGEMALMFPILFLGAAAFTAFVIISRLVHSQRSLIGTLRANGVRRRAILFHHLGLGVAPAAVGGLLGGLAGEGLALLISRMYTGALKIPITVIHPHPLVALTGFLMAVAAVAVAALAPALDAARVPPAEAMRGVQPVMRGGPSLIERVVPWLSRLPASAKLVLRGAVRNPGRSLTTIAGVVLALVLVMVSLGMLDTTKVLLYRQFDRIQQQDAQVYVSGTANSSLQQRLAAQPGVAAVEPALQAKVVVQANGHSYDTALTAFQPDTRMHAFLGRRDRTLTLPAQGVLLGSALRTRLSLGVGDPVTLDLTDLHRSVHTTLAGFVDEPLGTFAYAALPFPATPTASGASASRAAADAIAPNVFYVRYAAGVDRSSLRQRLQALPGVVAVIDSRGLKAAADQLMGLFYVVVGAMLVFGAALAFALIFSTMTVTISERSAELANLRAAGVSRAQIARIVGGENLVLVLLGLVPGLVLAYLTAAVFMDSFSSDMFRFDLHVTPLTWAVAVLAVVLAALASQLPALGNVNRMDLAAAVRERGQ
jgi:putative ABC transport system permease protein